MALKCVLFSCLLAIVFAKQQYTTTWLYTPTTDLPDSLYQQTKNLLAQITDEISDLSATINSSINNATNEIKNTISNKTDEYALYIKNYVDNQTAETNQAINDAFDYDVYECTTLKTHLTDLTSRTEELIVTYLTSVSRTSTKKFEDFLAETNNLTTQVNSLKRRLDNCHSYDTTCILEVSLDAVKLQQRITEDIQNGVGDVSGILEDVLKNIDTQCENYVTTGSNLALNVKQTIVSCVDGIRSSQNPIYTTTQEPETASTTWWYRN